MSHGTGGKTLRKGPGPNVVERNCRSHSCLRMACWASGKVIQRKKLEMCMLLCVKSMSPVEGFEALLTEASTAESYQPADLKQKHPTKIPQKKQDEKMSALRELHTRAVGLSKWLGRLFSTVDFRARARSDARIAWAGLCEMPIPYAVHASQHLPTFKQEALCAAAQGLAFRRNLKKHSDSQGSQVQLTVAPTANPNIENHDYDSRIVFFSQAKPVFDLFGFLPVSIKIIDKSCVHLRFSRKNIHPVGLRSRQQYLWPKSSGSRAVGPHLAECNTETS